MKLTETRVFEDRVFVRMTDGKADDQACFIDVMVPLTDLRQDNHPIDQRMPRLLLSVVQAAALRHARDAIAAEIRRLEDQSDAKL